MLDNRNDRPEILYVEGQKHWQTGTYLKHGLSNYPFTIHIFYRYKISLFLNYFVLTSSLNLMKTYRNFREHDHESTRCSVQIRQTKQYQIYGALCADIQKCPRKENVKRNEKRKRKR